MSNYRNNYVPDPTFDGPNASTYRPKQDSVPKHARLQVMQARKEARKASLTVLLRQLGKTIENVDNHDPDILESDTYVWAKAFCEEYEATR